MLLFVRLTELNKTAVSVSSLTMWEQTDSNLKRYNIDPKERLPSGHTRAWRTSNRVRSGQAATPAAKHLWGYRDSKNYMCGAATCDLNHIMTSCTHFGETEPRRHCRNEGWIRAVAESHCRHDMIIINEHLCASIFILVHSCTQVHFVSTLQLMVFLPCTW